MSHKYPASFIVLGSKRETLIGGHVMWLVVMWRDLLLEGQLLWIAIPVSTTDSINVIRYDSK